MDSALTAKNAASSVMQALPKWMLLTYGGLALPLGLAEVPIVVYLPAFYAQELRLSSAVVGMIFLLARLWDGLSDLVAGGLSDQTTSRYGRRKPWVLVGAPFLMLSTWFLCNPPQSAGLLYLTVWAALFYTAFTAVKIPHLSWGTELATDYLERTRVTTFRETFTMVGYLLFAAAPLLFLAKDAPLRQVLLLISLAVLVLVPLTVFPLAFYVPDAEARHKAPSRIRDALSVMVKDGVLWRFVIARLFWAIEEGVCNSLIILAFAVGLALPNKFFWAIFIIYVTTLCVLPLTLRIARRVEKHKLLALGVATQALVYGLVLFIPTGTFFLVAILWVVLGVATTTTLSLPTSILADIIDRGEIIGGERHSGAYVALDNLIYKIGMALGVGIAFGLLSWVHYDPSATHFTSTDARNIRLLGFGLPVLLLIPCFILYMAHPITRKMQRELRDEIHRREATQFRSSSLVEDDRKSASHMANAG